MSSCPTCNRKFQKNSKKIQKIKKHHYGFSSSQNKLGKAEKESKKNRSNEFLPTRNRKLKIKIAKNLKKLKNTITASLQDKISWERLRKREKKSFQ